MHNNKPAVVTKMQRRADWAISTLAALFLLLDAVGKLLRLGPVIEGTIRLGYTETVIVPLGIVLAVCTILYAIPRTAIVGSILLTGYLGGAVATHVRVADPMFAVVFPVILGILLWGGLWLREYRLRSLLPLVSRPATNT